MIMTTSNKHKMLSLTSDRLYALAAQVRGTGYPKNAEKIEKLAKEMEMME